MRIKRLLIRDFRNIEQTEFHASPGINFFEGLNGQGKTSILEAIGLLTGLSSFRTHRLDEVIRHSAQTSWISGQIVDADHPKFETQLKVTVTRPFGGGGAPIKSAWINEKLYRTASAYLAQRHASFQLGIHPVIFNPTDHDLVRGVPAARRAYLDRVIAAQDLAHLESVRRYQKALQQRNRILKDVGSAQSPEALSFESILIAEGARIAARRIDWLRQNEASFHLFLSRITVRQPPPNLRYFGAWLPSKPDSQEIELAELLEALSARFSKCRAQETLAGTTLVGPHRDDWDFALGDSNLQALGSQGETRSVLLALKLTEIKAFASSTGQKPVLLLDDFSSELDVERRAFLLENLDQSGLQVFVTATEAPSPRFAQNHVDTGKIRQTRSVFAPSSDQNQAFGK